MKRRQISTFMILRSPSLIPVHMSRVLYLTSMTFRSFRSKYNLKINHYVFLVRRVLYLRNLLIYSQRLGFKPKLIYALKFVFIPHKTRRVWCGILWYRLWERLCESDAPQRSKSLKLRTGCVGGHCSWHHGPLWSRFSVRSDNLALRLGCGFLCLFVMARSWKQ